MASHPASACHAHPLALPCETTVLLAPGVLIVDYIMVMSGEFTHLRNPKAVTMAAGIIRGMIN